MKKIIFGVTFLFILISTCKNSTQDFPKKITYEKLPNIILLIGDDQGYPYFGFMGADYVHTPNMDKLAASGIVFSNGYVPENHCRPSLQSLMTGTLPIDYNREVEAMLSEKLSKIKFESEESRRGYMRTFRHHAMQHFITLPTHLAKKGYRSFQGGKWWEFNFENGGFTHGMTTGWTAEERKNGGKWFKKFMGGDGLQLARATMQPAYDFIEKNSDQPFFIWYAPELPHYPFDAPEKYYNIYKNKKMTESAKRYYANCSWFDDGVGALLQFLEKINELDNTLFVYVNDNGWEQNPTQEFRHDSLRWHNGGDKGKLSMYDQSFRTPIIFSWKNKIQAGVVNNNLMHSADIPATILDILNLEIPENYFGKSYKKIIEGEDLDLRKNIVGKINKLRSEEDMMGKDVEGYWVREGKWFFNWNVTETKRNLFDLSMDQFNYHNIAEKHPDISDNFIKKIKAWKASKKR